ncbi:hypothetical protein [Legionella tunisiensis]|uniref:hypothetical protein n=1 Tax=Legionella tunisiensis TaxID=1034944 RepID=UPI0002F997FB|nr:hypothetical protein [Legionella tunisiensis]
MSIDIETIKELFKFLEEKLVNENSEARRKIYLLHQPLALSISKKLSSAVAEAQQAILSTGKKLPSNYRSANLAKERDELLNNINEAIQKISTYEALVLCVMNCFKQGLKGCQEHATLVSLALMSLYGVNKGPKAENVMLEIPGTRLNHEFVVLARAEGSALDEVATWGNGLVLDSYGHWFAGVDNLPLGTGIANLLHDKTKSGLTVKVFHDNKMKLNLLNRYKDDPNHPYHTIEKTSLTILTNNITSFVENAMTTLALPTLRELPSPLPCTDSFFSVASAPTTPNQCIPKERSENGLGI